MHLGRDGLIVAWSSPIGPAVARFETWAREAPVFARTLGHPGLDRPVTPLVWRAAGHLVVIWCEEEGALAATVSMDGVRASKPVRIVPGARAIAIAPGEERATLFAADEAGIARVELDVQGTPLAAPRRCVAARRAGAVLAAARLRDEAVLVFVHRGEASLGVVATRGDDEVVVRHPLGAPCDDVSLDAAGGRAGVALELGGTIAIAVLGVDGRLLERPRPVLERAGMTLGSPRMLWTEDRWTLLAHDRGADRLIARPLGERGAEDDGFTLPRCQGAFAAAYWAQGVFALELTPQGEGGELRLWRCARDGAAPQQRVTDLVLEDASPRLARLAAREALSSLSSRMIRSSYRDAPARLELARDGASLTVLDEEGRLTVGLSPEDAGVRLRVASALGDDPRLPEAPSSVVRLARWIKQRLSADARAEALRERAFGEERASELGGTVIRLERAGAVLVLELALAALPDAEVLEPWLRALRRAQRTFARVDPA